MKLLKKVVIAVLIVTVFCSQVTAAFAKTKDQAQAEIDKLEEEKQQLESELSQYETEKANTQAAIDALDAQMNEVKVQITANEDQLRTINNKILDLKAEITIARNKERTQYKALKMRIKQLYEDGDTQYLEILLKSEDMSTLVNNSQYISKINTYDSQLLEDIQATIDEINAIEEEQKTQLKAAEEVKVALAEQKAELDQILYQKGEELIALNAISEQTRDQIAGVEEDIDAEKQIIASIEAAEAAAREAKKQMMAAGTYVNYNPSYGFWWPAPGYGSISSSFGNRICPFHGPEFHNGIDIPMGYGSNVIASKNGMVVAACYDGSLGNYIIIDHGDGSQTFYLHNSDIYVTTGQYVDQGQVIAAAGSTGSSTGCHLDFRVKFNGYYVNPLGYVSP